MTGGSEVAAGWVEPKDEWPAAGVPGPRTWPVRSVEDFIHEI